MVISKMSQFLLQNGPICGPLFILSKSSGKKVAHPWSIGINEQTDMFVKKAQQFSLQHWYTSKTTQTHRLWPTLKHQRCIFMQTSNQRNLKTHSIILSTSQQYQSVCVWSVPVFKCADLILLMSDEKRKTPRHISVDTWWSQTQTVLSDNWK